MLPTNIEQLLEDMRGCKNSVGQSVLAHGEWVYRHYEWWRDGIQNWNKPDWLSLIKSEDLHSNSLIEQYAKLHDCGKPYCRVEDLTGVHYPNHAQISSDVFYSLFKDSITAKLIKDDMILHSAKAEEIQDKLDDEWSRKDALTLLIIALCEIHSNAELFGGTDSVSFKIKWATLNRRGKQIFRHFGLDKAT